MQSCIIYRKFRREWNQIPGYLSSGYNRRHFLEKKLWASIPQASMSYLSLVLSRTRELPLVTEKKRKQHLVATIPKTTRHEHSWKSLLLVRAPRLATTHYATAHTSHQHIPYIILRHITSYEMTPHHHVTLTTKHQKPTHTEKEDSTGERAHEQREFVSTGINATLKFSTFCCKVI